MSTQPLESDSGSRSETNVASAAGSGADFEDVPLTEPDDDIRPELDGDAGDLPSDEELEAMFGKDEEIEAMPSLTPEADDDVRLAVRCPKSRKICGKKCSIGTFRKICSFSVEK